LCGCVDLGPHGELDQLWRHLRTSFRSWLHLAVDNLNRSPQQLAVSQVADEVGQRDQRRAAPLDRYLTLFLLHGRQPEHVGKAPAHVVEELDGDALAAAKLGDERDPLPQLLALRLELLHLCQKRSQSRGFLLGACQLRIELR